MSSLKALDDIVRECVKSASIAPTTHVGTPRSPARATWLRATPAGWNPWEQVRGRVGRVASTHLPALIFRLETGRYLVALRGCQAGGGSARIVCMSRSPTAGAELPDPRRTPRRRIPASRHRGCGLAPLRRGRARSPVSGMADTITLGTQGPGRGHSTCAVAGPLARWIVS